MLINPRKYLEEEFRKEEREIKKKQKVFVTEPRKREIQSKIKSVFDCMKIRNIIFIIMEFILIIFFFYLIISFCCLFKSAQINWLLDWIVSFFLSEIVLSPYSSSYI